MHKKTIERKILIIALTIFSIISIILLGLIPIDYSLIVGWVLSSGVSLIVYFISLQIIKIIMKRKSKYFSWALTLARNIIIYAFHVITIIILIWVDKKQSGLGFMQKNAMSALYKPINIFAYLGGIAIIPVSTLIANTFMKGR